MTSEEYKALSVKEFTEAAKIYDSGHSGVYEMCKDDYPFLLEELEKESFNSVLDCGCGTGPAIELLQVLRVFLLGKIFRKAFHRSGSYTGDDPCGTGEKSV